MYQGEGQQGYAAVTILVQGVELAATHQHNSKTKYVVAFQTARQPIYGTTHTGALTGWHDSFAINLKDFQTDNLSAILFVDDDTFGTAWLSLMDVATGSGPARSERRVELLHNREIVGYLVVNIEALAKEQVVGGLRPPKVTLRSGAVEYVEPFVERGVEKNVAQHLNIFSCMDASDIGWQPYPAKFKSRLRSTYDIKN